MNSKNPYTYWNISLGTLEYWLGCTLSFLYWSSTKSTFYTKKSCEYPPKLSMLYNDQPYFH